MKYSKAELEALVAASPRSLVPLDKLVFSAEHQARTAGSAPKLSILELLPRSRKSVFFRT